MREEKYRFKVIEVRGEKLELQEHNYLVRAPQK